MPLGRPVEPDEYIQNAMSSRWVSASGRSVENPCSHCCAMKVFGTACSPAAPLTTIRVCSGVSLQASALNREVNSASATATAAPASER